MALLTVQNTLLTGLAPVYSAVSSSDTFPNDGNTVLHVKNAGGSSDTCTIDSVTACNQGADHDGGGSVPATTGDRIFGPFNTTRFNTSTGVVTVTHSFTTSVTCAVLRLPPATS